MTGRQRNKTKIAHTTLIFLMTLFSASQVFSQRIKDTSGIAINCQIQSVILANKDLVLKISLKNDSNAPRDFYKELVEGAFMGEMMAAVGKEIVNLHFLVEKKKGTTFLEYSNRVYLDPSPSDTSDLDRVRIDPNDSLNIYYHVDSRYEFKQGNYRIKCRYWNDTTKDGYIESKWVHFRVAKMIHIKHYSDQESFN